MRQREPWQHEWSRPAKSETDSGMVRVCVRRGCPWEMLSRQNSNRYRNGPDGKWMHAPKDCEGEQK